MTSTLGTIVLVGGELLGVWDSSGERIKNVTQGKQAPSTSTFVSLNAPPINVRID